MDGLDCPLIYASHLNKRVVCVLYQRTLFVAGATSTPTCRTSPVTPNKLEPSQLDHAL